MFDIVFMVLIDVSRDVAAVVDAAVAAARNAAAVRGRPMWIVRSG